MADAIETPPVLRKKVAGIPVIAILGVFVLVLAVVAYRMRNTNAQDEVAASAVPGTPADDDEGYSDSALLAGSGDTSGYDAFVAKGSVTQAPADVDADAVADATNEDWVRKGTEWLVTTHGVSGGAAQAALTKYIQGDNLSFTEGGYRDLCIKQFGVPPESIGAIGSTGKAPAQRQGNPPCTHTVKGASDDGYAELAQLYYGRNTNEVIDLMQNANKELGKGGPFMVGTKIKIPAYHSAKYYTSTKSTNTASEIARKNGTSTSALYILNDGMKFPVKAGTKVRVA